MEGKRKKEESRVKARHGKSASIPLRFHDLLKLNSSRYFLASCSRVWRLFWKSPQIPSVNKADPWALFIPFLPPPQFPDTSSVEGTPDIPAQRYEYAGCTNNREPVGQPAPSPHHQPRCRLAATNKLEPQYRRWSSRTRLWGPLQGLSLDTRVHRLAHDETNHADINSRFLS
jgi:hypothetical protein